MTSAEKIALVKAGISSRYADYRRVRELQYRSLRVIEIETGYSRHFITQCRKIAGWKRRKNEI